MRTLHVGDTATFPEPMPLGLVWTYTLRQNKMVEKRQNNEEYKVFVEWMKPGSKTAFALTLDEFLFSKIAESQLHFSDDKEQAVRHIAKACNALSRKIY